MKRWKISWTSEAWDIKPIGSRQRERERINMAERRVKRGKKKSKYWVEQEV